MLVLRLVVSSCFALGLLAACSGSDAEHHDPEPGPIDAVSADPAGPDSGGPDELTVDATGPPVVVGSPCTLETACPAGGSGTPACLVDWPEGYCAVKDCTAHGHDCPSDAGQGGTAGSKCIEGEPRMCLALCNSGADCRTGYACVSKPDAAGHGAVAVCIRD